MKIKLVLIDSYKGEKTVVSTDAVYPYSDKKHIDRWRYSPEGSSKQIETFFG